MKVYKITLSKTSDNEVGIYRDFFICTDGDVKKINLIDFCNYMIIKKYQADSIVEKFKICLDILKKMNNPFIIIDKNGTIGSVFPYFVGSITYSIAAEMIEPYYVSDCVKYFDPLLEVAKYSE